METVDTFINVDLFSSCSIVQPLLAHFAPQICAQVVLNVWLFTLELWVPEVPKHIKDVGRGKRKMRRCFFGSIVALWNCLSCLQCRSCCSVCVCQAPCHPAIVQARNQHRPPLFYTQICSYRLLCPISLHFVMFFKNNTVSSLSYDKRSPRVLLLLLSLCGLEVKTTSYPSNWAIISFSLFGPNMPVWQNKKTTTRDRVDAQVHKTGPTVKEDMALSGSK